MFQELQALPEDPILRYSTEFNHDNRSHKINLTVGMYYDEESRIPVFQAVQLAEKAILEAGHNKNYFPIDGPIEYRTQVSELILGKQDERVTVCYAPGGTGAVRLGAELIKKARPSSAVWISDPTWNVHCSIFQQCGFVINKYQYLESNGTLRFSQVMQCLSQAKPGDCIVLHGCCHNPTGIDPTPSQWNALFELLKEKKVTPFFDMPYHGFANGLEEDMSHIRLAIEKFDDVMVAYSFSKTMGLYCDRVGALLVKTKNDSAANIIGSHLRFLARMMFSNPPAHGIRIVECVLKNKFLRKQWQEELDSCRKRLKFARKKMALELSSANCNFAHLGSGNGMFSLTGLNSDEVLSLKKRFGIYLLQNGRINIAALNDRNIPIICNAILQVIN